MTGRGSEPPLARGLPLLGSVRALLRDPCDFFFRTYQELGPVFRVRGGTRQYTVLAGHEANRLQSQLGDDVLQSTPVYRPYVDELKTEKILIALDGDEHRQYRRMLKPGLCREALVPHVPHMVAAVERVVRSCVPGEWLNVTKVMQFLVAQQVGLALAGRPIDDHFEDASTFAHVLLGAGVGGYPGVLRYLPSYRASKRRMLAFLRDVIERHRADPPGAHRNPDLVDALLAARWPDGRPLDETQLVASIHMPYTNSLVYVGALCGFLLYRLLKHADVREHVLAEVDAMFARGAPDLSTLRQSRWLRGALLETQRLHPIALSTPRYVANTFEFAGYEIPAGATTLTATAVCHFLPEFFPDPFRFDPERHSPPRSEHRQPGAFVPFGLDAHACLAAGLVDSVAMLTVATVLRSVRLELESPAYELGLSIRPFPAPDRRFRVRVVGARVPAAATRDAPRDPFALGPDVDRARLGRIMAGAARRRCEPGEVVVRQGEAADAFYVIADGSVEVIKEPPGRAPQAVARLERGQYFGEIGLLQNVPRTATVRARDRTELLAIGRDAFVELVAESDLTSREIAETVHRRLMASTLATALPRLASDQVTSLLPGFELRHYEPGTVLVRQGDVADRFYLVVRGEVDVINHHPAGRDIVVARLSEGDYFGEIGLLQGVPRTATVRASADGGVDVMSLDRSGFDRLVAGSQGSRDDISEVVNRRLLDLSTKVSAGAVG